MYVCIYIYICTYIFTYNIMVLPTGTSSGARGSYPTESSRTSTSCHGSWGTLLPSLSFRFPSGAKQPIRQAAPTRPEVWDALCITFCRKAATSRTSCTRHRTRGRLFGAAATWAGGWCNFHIHQTHVHSFECLKTNKDRWPLGVMEMFRQPCAPWSAVKFSLCAAMRKVIFSHQVSTPESTIAKSVRVISMVTWLQQRKEYHPAIV